MCSSSLKWAVLATFLLTVAAEAKELRVCADPNNLPFSNDREEGFENKVADLIARDIGATVTYTWHAQRRGFLRETLKAERCDLVMGLPSNMEGVRTTAPYYRSSYVFVTREGEPEVVSFNDEALHHRIVGVQIVGDDGWNTPPAHAMSRRGIVANVRGYSLYGDYRDPNPPARIIRAVAEGEVDIAIVWGPLAGYFSSRQSVPLHINPVRPQFDGPKLPMVWDISMAVRSEDEILHREIDAAIAHHRSEIDAILAQFGVPRLDGASQQAEVAR